MAVYKKSYHGYEGSLTPSWSRFLVIPRYAFEEMHRSRFLTIFFLASFIYPLLCAFFIYLNFNLSALNVLNLENVAKARGGKLFTIDSDFFLTLLGWQSMLAFFLSAFIGPGQVSPDLVNNGLPLYLARPFSRTEYVLGKASVLLILLSLMTWVPGLLLFGLQSYLEGAGWASGNWQIASGIFLGAWIWILVLTMLALALSAWVKWKPAAGALMFGTFFVAAGFGEAFNGVMRTKWGHVLNISYLIGTVWVSMFDEPARRSQGALFFRIVRGEQIPTWCCWAALIAICLLCLYMLSRKIRGAEVVR